MTRSLVGLVFTCALLVACDPPPSASTADGAVVSDGAVVAPLASFTAPLLADGGVQAVIALRAARMIDPRSGTVTEHGVVLVRGKTIEAAGANVAIPSDARIIDLGSATLIPGLVDAHTHLLANHTMRIGSDSWNMVISVATQSTAERALLGAKNAREDLWSGITTVRDVGNSGVGGDVALSRAISKGWVQGSHVVPCTRALSPTGGQFARLQPEAEQLVAQEYVAIAGPDDARRAVRQAVFDGAECIKVIVDPPQATLSSDELRAIVEEAHRAKKRVAAHAVRDDAAALAVEAGVDSIEHGYELKEATLRKMVEKKTFLVPTDYPLDFYLMFVRAAVGIPEADREKAIKSMTPFHDGNRARLALASKLGVRIVAGSDAYYEVPGMTRGQTSLLVLRAYAESGMSPLEILRSATSNAADLLYAEPKIGALAPGMIADVIAVDGNPLTTADALEHVTFVMSEGVVVKEAH